MLSISIKDIKQFMNKLLVKDTFDKMLLSEATIVTGNTFNISGCVNRSFYTDSEWEALDNHDYSCWGVLKPFCFSVIKGTKVPTSMKIIFLLSKETTQEIITLNNLDYELKDINGLFLNVRYTEGQLSVITGVSTGKFTLDKSLDKAFESYICNFLEKSQINFDIL